MVQERYFVCRRDFWCNAVQLGILYKNCSGCKMASVTGAALYPLADAAPPFTGRGSRTLPPGLCFTLTRVEAKTEPAPDRMKFTKLRDTQRSAGAGIR